MDQSLSSAPEPLPADLTSLVESTNESLETSVNQATHQAFNLGCLIGLLPAAVFAGVTFMITGFSLIGASMAVVLGITGAIAFANLAAMITRRNTLRRTYQDQVDPQITASLAGAGYTREQFDLAARETLSSSDLLYSFVQPLPVQSEEPSSDDEVPSE